MSQIMKAFTGIFVILFMMTAATGMLGVFFQTIYAQNLHAVMIDEMENSNYAKTVINECFIRAFEKGYNLEITLYTQDGEVLECKSSMDLPLDMGKVLMAKVTLKYPLKVSFFELDLMQEEVGYGR